MLKYMSDEHLVYTYNLFKDQGDKNRIEILEEELKLRGITYDKILGN